MFNNTSAPEYDPLFTEKGLWYGWVVCLDSGLNQKETLKEQTRLSIALREQFLSSLDRECRGALTTTDSGKLEITIFKEMGRDSSFCEVGETLKTLAVAGKGLKLSFIPIEKTESFQNYRRELEKAEALAPLRLVRDAEKLQETNDPAVLEYSRKLENLLTLAGTSHKKELDELFLELKEIESPLNNTQEEYTRKFFTSLLPELENSRSFLELIQSFSGEEEEIQDGPSILVQQALRIIREEFDHDTGIAQIAYKLQVTPNYLSSLFHKHTGTPFTRYITEIRMKQSQTAPEGDQPEHQRDNPEGRLSLKPPFFRTFPPGNRIDPYGIYKEIQRVSRIPTDTFPGLFLRKTPLFRQEPPHGSWSEQAIR